MAKKIEFPRHLYKGDGEIQWNHGLTYDKIYVTDKNQYDKAIKKGFIDDFEEALYGEKAEYEIIEDDVEPESIDKPGNVVVAMDDF